MALVPEKTYTIDDIYALPDGKRAELIDGQIYDMTPPSRKHQEILSFLQRDAQQSCGVLTQNHNKLNERGCNGAPDWIIEIVSPSSHSMDYYTKLSLYRSAGVREYWIVDPIKQTILNYDMEHDSAHMIYSIL